MNSMKSWLRFVVSLILICCLLVDAQEPKKRSKRPKATRTPPTCPDNCALKRRIGKVELRFEGDVSEVKSACLGELKTLRSEILEQNVTEKSGSSKTSNGGISTEEVDAKILRAVAEFRLTISQQQTKLTDALSQVEKLSMLPNLQEELYESRQREYDLHNTIGVMNRTLYILQSQNFHLQQQTQAIRSQSAVLRANNVELTEENRELMKLARTSRPETSENLRITDAEENIIKHSSTLNSMQQQIEWLSDQINVLSDKVDAAAFEAAKASETSGRAETLARQAIAVARRQPGARVETESPEKLDPRNLPQPDQPPNDCWELYQMGYNISGIYRVRPFRASEVFQVYCEQSYNGGGWTLIQKRRDGSVDFDRNWQSYAEGFGDLDGEMWLGNDKIFFLTNQDTYTLQVILLDWEGHRAYAEYEGFRIHSNNDYYAAQLGRFVRGDAGDALRGAVDDGSRNAHLARFTTNDVDNDNCRPCLVDRNAFENCAEIQGGGWWFRACSDSNLNGRYIQPRDFPACGDGCFGITWRTWRSDPNYSLKASIMLIKPVTATTET